MTTRPLAVLPALALLLPAPAWSAHGEPEVSGTTCTLAATGEPEGSVRSGVVSAGPWVSTSPGAAVVSVACSVQVGTDNPAEPDAARVDARGGLLAPTPVSYGAQATDTNVFVCTEITVHWPPDPPTVYPYDADPHRPGAQCARAQHSSNALVVVDIAPSNPASWWCVRVDHGLPPYGYQEVCKP